MSWLQLHGLIVISPFSIFKVPVRHFMTNIHDTTWRQSLEAPLSKRWKQKGSISGWLCLLECQQLVLYFLVLDSWAPEWCSVFHIPLRCIHLVPSSKRIKPTAAHLSVGVFQGPLDLTRVTRKWDDVFNLIPKYYHSFFLSLKIAFFFFSLTWYILIMVSPPSTLTHLSSHLEPPPFCLS